MRRILKWGSLTVGGIVALLVIPSFALLTVQVGVNEVGSRVVAVVVPPTPTRTPDPSPSPTPAPTPTLPPNTQMRFTVTDIFKTSSGARKFNYEMKNNSTWEARDINVRLTLKDGSGTEVYSDTLKLNPLGPGSIQNGGLPIVPETVKWELYSLSARWRWYRDSRYSNWNQLSGVKR